jgi:hypothetical protein
MFTTYLSAMQTSRQLLVLSLLTWGLLGSQPSWAQCLPLARLRASVMTGVITPDSLQALLPPGQWTLHPGENPYWTYQEPTQPSDETEAGEYAWVGLRRSNKQGSYDLVYKTIYRECITQLRTELRRQSKLKSEYVNCVQCESERLTGDGFTVTIFNQKASYVAKRTPYPFVLVVRRTADGPGTGSPAADALSQQEADRH